MAQPRLITSARPLSVLEFQLKTVSPVEVGLGPGMGQRPVGQPPVSELDDRRHRHRQGLVRRHHPPYLQFQGNAPAGPAGAGR